MSLPDIGAISRTNPNFLRIIELASKRQRKLYLVGGYIRDLLNQNRGANSQEAGTEAGSLGGAQAGSEAGSLAGAQAGSHKDLDFMVMNGPAIEFARECAELLQAHFVLLDEENDTGRVVTDNQECFDFAHCVGGSLESDLKRRDFSVNAIAFDPESGELIDKHGGICDIEKRTLRAISEKSFIDDPLRLLRAHRFAALLGFDIEKESYAYICKHKKLIANVAAERICTEFFLMLETENSGAQIKLMGESGLLEEIFPELSACHKVTKNAYHHLGLFDHSIETLIQVEVGFKEIPEPYKNMMKSELAGGVSRIAASKLAGLIHDIGKPDTWVVTEEGKHTFIGHDKLGAQMCEPIARRLKWAKQIERLIEKLVRWHLRPGQLFHQGMPTDKARYRFYKTIGDDLPELILIALADFRSTCGPGLQVGRREAEENLFELLRNFSVYQVSKIKESRFLDGTDLMKLLGIKPGPVVGELLEDLLEAQALGEVKNRDQAVEFARKLYEQKYCR